MNLVAVHYLTLSFKQKEHLDFIKDARTDNCPSGLVCEIWRNLENEFRPSDVSAEAELTKKLMGLTLEKGEDPRKLGKRIAIIQTWFKFQVEETKKFWRS